MSLNSPRAAPGRVRVCAWQRAVRPTRSKRAISAWEPLIVHRGRELPLDQPQSVRDALSYSGRFRGFPGALVGMKPQQLSWSISARGWRAAGARADDLSIVCSEQAVTCPVNGARARFVSIACIDVG